MKAAFTDELRALRNSGVRIHSTRPRQNTSIKPVKDLNSLLRHIYEVQDKPVRDSETPKYFKVFQAISLKLNDLMKELDPYYARYSVVRFAGRHDRLRIDKPDTFDMEIVIGLPIINEGSELLDAEDIAPGFLKLRIGDQLQTLKNDENLQMIQTASRWFDKDNFLHRSLFMAWFKSIVDKAIGLFDMLEDNLPSAINGLYVEGHPYTLRLVDDTSPTLIVEDTRCGFRMDMDLVPCIEFLDNKCGKMPNKVCKSNNFLVVPKSMRGGADAERSWRHPLKLEEIDLLYMKQIIRLIKKLRDSYGIAKITSYCIKTIFYHEAIAQEHDPDFWSRDFPAKPFIHMVKKLYQYLESKHIPYFWNEDYNLINSVDDSTLDGYAKKLKRLVKILEDPTEYKLVAKFLMPESQFKDYKNKILKV